jgi:hypothetical protein
MNKWDVFVSWFIFMYKYSIVDGLDALYVVVFQETCTFNAPVVGCIGTLLYLMESFDTRGMQVIYPCPWYQSCFPKRLNLWDGGSTPYAS